MVNLDIKKKMALILSLGQILAENGAATDKIISDTKRVATLMKIPEENFNRPPNFWGVLFLLSALYTPEIEKCYMILEKSLGHTMKKGPLHVSKQESFLTP